MKYIKLKDVLNIEKLAMEIFEEEDNDYVDRRKLVPKEKAINKILSNITNDIYTQNEIYRVLTKGIPFNVIVLYLEEQLNSIGYGIEREVVK